MNVTVTIEEDRESISTISGTSSSSSSEYKYKSPTEKENDDKSGKHYWRKYDLFLFCALVGNGTDVVPLAVKYVLRISGGLLVLLLLVFSTLFGLPLVYAEMFLGRYTRLTNGQQYRMAPLFFGVSIMILIFNVWFQPLMVVDDTKILVGIWKVLFDPDIYRKCMADSGDSCYDYKINGPFKEMCECHQPGICNGTIQLRYPSFHAYWKFYSEYGSTHYKVWETVGFYCVYWFFVAVIIKRGIRLLCKFLNGVFVLQLAILTLLFIMSLTVTGSLEGLTYLLQVHNLDIEFDELLLTMWFSINRLGIIVPTGYMTNSAHSNFKSNLATDCFLLIVGSTSLFVYLLAIFFSLSGVVAHAMGVPLPCVVAPDRGIYLSVVPEFFALMQMPTVFLVVYFVFIWLLEVLKLVIFIYMLINNFYEFFPKLKAFEVYVWRLSCLCLCIIGLPFTSNYATTIVKRTIQGMYSMYGFPAAITLVSTMIFYFYGAGRLSDDIYFHTLKKPMKFWRIMWYILPAFGWISLFFLATKIEGSTGETDLVRKSKLYIGIIFWSIFSIGILSSIVYVTLQMLDGVPFKKLLKPQFYWGPPDRQRRMDRKNFNPRTAIRSQAVVSRRKKSDASGTLQHDSKALKDSGEKRGRIFSDTQFFSRIGITTHPNHRNAFALKEKK